MATISKTAKPTANRAARRAAVATAAKQDAPTPQDTSTPTPPVVPNFDADALIAAVRADLDDLDHAETGMVKKVQHMAYMIYQYRDAMPNEKHWTTLHESPTVRNEWMGAMRKIILGTAPSLAKAVSQENRTARSVYGTRLRNLDQALWLCLALGLKGVDASAYSETLNCFKVPPACIIEKGFVPALDLADAIAATPDVAIMLDRSLWTVTGRNKDGKSVTQDIRASVAQVMVAYRSKPVTVPTIVPNVTPGGVAIPAGQSPTATTTDKASAQQNPASSIEPKTRAVVLKTSTIPQLATAMLAALDDDPAIDTAKSQFSDAEWNTLMLLAQRLGIMAHKAQSQIDKAAKTNGNDKPAKAA